MKGFLEDGLKQTLKELLDTSKGVLKKISCKRSEGIDGQTSLKYFLKKSLLLQ